MDEEGIRQAKAELLQRAGHGARNCLNGIVGMVELLRQPGGSADPGFHAALADSAAELGTLLQPLLDIATADAGKTPEPVALPIRRLLDDLAAFHDLLARGRLVRVSCEVAEAVAPTVRADRLKLALLLHLVTARVVAACAEGGTVRIEAAADGTRLALTFTGAPAAAGPDRASAPGAASVHAGLPDQFLAELGASVTPMNLPGAVGIRVGLQAR